jgi:tetratricopeptide (TPR) repeat protein
MRIISTGRISLVIVWAMAAAVFVGCEKKVERQGRMVSPNEARQMDMAAAERAVARAEFNDAMAIYDQFLADFPKAPEMPLVHLKRGEIFYWQKNYEAAEREFQLVVTNYPLISEAQEAAWGLGLCYYKQKRWHDAAAALSPIYETTTDPDRRSWQSAASGKGTFSRQQNGMPR